MEAKSIDKLIGKTVRIKVDKPKSNKTPIPEYYQGKLVRLASSYRIWDPETVYSNGTKKQMGGFRTVRQIDLDESRVEVIKHPARKLY